jgi:hypothetical protein
MWELGPLGDSSTAAVYDSSAGSTEQTCGSMLRLSHLDKCHVELIKYKTWRQT